MPWRAGAAAEWAWKALPAAQAHACITARTHEPLQMPAEAGWRRLRPEEGEDRGQMEQTPSCRR